MKLKPDPKIPTQNYSLDEFLDNHASDDLIWLRKDLKPYTYGFSFTNPSRLSYKQILNSATSKTLVSYDS